MVQNILCQLRSSLIVLCVLQQFSVVKSIFKCRIYEFLRIDWIYPSHLFERYVVSTRRYQLHESVDVLCIDVYSNLLPSIEFNVCTIGVYRIGLEHLLFIQRLLVGFDCPLVRTKYCIDSLNCVLIPLVYPLQLALVCTIKRSEHIVVDCTFLTAVHPCAYTLHLRIHSLCLVELLTDTFVVVLVECIEQSLRILPYIVLSLFVGNCVSRIGLHCVQFVLSVELSSIPYSRRFNLGVYASLLLACQIVYREIHLLVEDVH